MGEKQLRSIEWLDCVRCGHSPVNVITAAPVGMVHFNDAAECPSCGLKGHAEVDGPEEAYVVWDDF
ncbi:hypothetical protein HV144_17150 [Citrobacter freundii]|nr:hypothetical protein [Citrobacter freundii]